MLQALRTFVRLLKGDKRGVTAIEYAVIAGVMVVVVGIAFGELGSQIKGVFTGMSSSISNSVTNAVATTNG